MGRGKRGAGRRKKLPDTGTGVGVAIACAVLGYLVFLSGLSILFPSHWRWSPPWDGGVVRVAETIAFVWAAFFGAFAGGFLLVPVPGDGKPRLRFRWWARQAAALTLSVIPLRPIGEALFSRGENPGGWAILGWTAFAIILSQAIRFAAKARKLSHGGSG